MREIRDDYPYELEYDLVAEGDQGDERWNPAFSSIKQVQQIVSRLDEFGSSDKIDWKSFVGNHTYFNLLSQLNFPPLYRLDDFVDLSNDFWQVLDPPENDDAPGQSFNWSRLYLKKAKVVAVKVEFDEFLKHLQSLPWVQEIL